ncbi:hypothetical protein QJS66_00945 [Kocuria rhizophila]|nr:hypothetical protein QJS66_00945 [Kocuria rhizophila]
MPTAASWPATGSTGVRGHGERRGLRRSIPGRGLSAKAGAERRVLRGHGLPRGFWGAHQVIST